MRKGLLVGTLLVQGEAGCAHPDAFVSVTPLYELAPVPRPVGKALSCGQCGRVVVVAVSA